MRERQGLDLRQDRFVLAQGLQDDVAVRMILRFFGRQHAFFASCARRSGPRSGA